MKLLQRIKSKSSVRAKSITAATICALTVVSYAGSLISTVLGVGYLSGKAFSSLVNPDTLKIISFAAAVIAIGFMRYKIELIETVGWSILEEVVCYFYPEERIRIGYSEQHLFQTIKDNAYYAGKINEKATTV